MITKFCIVGLCMTASAMLGLLYYKRKKARLLYVASLVKLTDALISEMSFRKEDLLTSLRHFAENDRTELAKQIRCFCESPYTPLHIEGKWLHAEEKQRVTDFFAALGDTDSKTQILTLENEKQIFVRWYDEENERFKRSGGLGLKLSVLFGLAVGILIL